MTVSKPIPNELLDTLLSGYQKPEDLIGENGLLKQLRDLQNSKNRAEFVARTA